MCKTISIINTQSKMLFIVLRKLFWLLSSICFIMNFFKIYNMHLLHFTWIRFCVLAKLCVLRQPFKCYILHLKSLFQFAIFAFDVAKNTKKPPNNMRNKKIMPLSLWQHQGHQCQRNVQNTWQTRANSQTNHGSNKTCCTHNNQEFVC